MCAVCRFADVPALWPVSRLTQHATVTRVCAACRTVPSDPTLAAQAAREAPVIPRHHDERRVGRSCCANDKHRQLRGREERAELKGARVHADVVRKDPLGHMLAHVPPCLLNSAWLPSLDPIFFGDHPCTTRQAASMLVERIGDGRALHPCGQGGASVRETVPERLGAPRARFGRFR